MHRLGGHVHSQHDDDDGEADDERKKQQRKSVPTTARHRRPRPRPRPTAPGRHRPAQPTVHERRTSASLLSLMLAANRDSDSAALGALRHLLYRLGVTPCAVDQRGNTALDLLAFLLDGLRLDDGKLALDNKDGVLQSAAQRMAQGVIHLGPGVQEPVPVPLDPRAPLPGVAPLGDLVRRLEATNAARLAQHLRTRTADLRRLLCDRHVVHHLAFCDPSEPDHHDSRHFTDEARVRQTLALSPCHFGPADAADADTDADLAQLMIALRQAPPHGHAWADVEAAVKWAWHALHHDGGGSCALFNARHMYMALLGHGAEERPHAVYAVFDPDRGFVRVGCTSGPTARRFHDRTARMVNDKEDDGTNIFAAERKRQAAALNRARPSPPLSLPHASAARLPGASGALRSPRRPGTEMVWRANDPGLAAHMAEERGIALIGAAGASPESVRQHFRALARRSQDRRPLFSALPALPRWADGSVCGPSPPSPPSPPAPLPELTVREELWPGGGQHIQGCIQRALDAHGVSPLFRLVSAAHRSRLVFEVVGTAASAAATTIYHHHLRRGRLGRRPVAGHRALAHRRRDHLYPHQRVHLAPARPSTARHAHRV